MLPGGVGSTVPVDGGVFAPPPYVLIIVVSIIQVVDCTVELCYVYMLYVILY